MTLYVNDQEVKDELIQAEVQNLRPHYEKAFADTPQDQNEKQLLDWSRENVIERTLITQAAEREITDITDEHVEQAYQNIISQNPAIAEKDTEMIKADILSHLKIEKLINQITVDCTEPTETEIQEYYKKNIEHFTIPEMVRASHIVLHPSPDVSEQEQKQKLESVLQEIKAGESFEKKAAEFSDCGDNGGDLGYFARGKMVPEFEDVVFAMQPDQVSEVFKTQFGYHVAKVTDRKEEMPCDIAHAREMILNELRQQVSQNAVNDFVDKEKTKATILDK